MPGISIHIDRCEGAAFGDNEDDFRRELYRILRTLATQVRDGEEPARLFDINGNAVGRVSIQLPEYIDDDYDDEDDEDDEE